MTGGKIQLYNGIILITTFFSCRLVYGGYQSFLVLQDVYHAIGGTPGQDSKNGVMVFVTENSTVPMWLAAAYLGSNLTLNSLNTYWFFKMIQALQKRFQSPTEVPLPDKSIFAGESTALDSSLSSNLKSRSGATVNGESELDYVN